jgi:hypothetical protein
MRATHTPHNLRASRVATRSVAPPSAARDEHIDHLRGNQRSDQANFDDADLSNTPAPRTVNRNASRLTPEQIQSTIQQLRQRLSSPLKIPSTHTSIVTGSSSSVDQTGLSSNASVNASTDRQVTLVDDQLNTDDVSTDVPELDRASTLQGMNATNPASYTHIPFGAYTPGGQTHSIMSQLAAMQQQLRLMTVQLHTVTQERDTERIETQRLRTESQTLQQRDSERASIKSESTSGLHFPSLSPFGSPVSASSTIKTDVKPPVSTYSQAEGSSEHKYDSDDKKHIHKQVHKMSNLPDIVEDATSDNSDDDEDKVRDRDRRPDTTIRLPENVDDDHLDSYPEWALQRERLFPYDSADYRKLYTTRYTLLSARGRRLEWMRTAVSTRFHASLFGQSARQWFEAVMQTLGVPLPSSTRKYRNVDLSRPPPVKIPDMYYDDRDLVTVEADDAEPDLPPNSYTFARLPRQLRSDPIIGEQAQDHNNTLTDMIKMYARQLQLTRIARAPASSATAGKHHDDDDDQSSPCRRCKKNKVYGLKIHCHTCELELAKIKQDQIDQSWMPKMEADLVEPNMTVKIEQYGNQSSAARVPVRKHMTYREQEKELTVIGERSRDRLRNETSSDADLQEEEASPLGSVLSVVFQPHQRPLLRRIARTDLVSFRDRNAALIAAGNALTKFDGTSSKAPKYLQDLCTQIQTYKFNEQEIVALMNKTMIDAANQWLQTNLAEVFQLPDKPMQVLLMRFKEHYVGAHVVRDIRKQLASTVLTTTTPSIKDLDTHYASYTALLTQLRFSDRFVDDKEVLTEYFSSLPYTIRTFIGSSFAALTSINDLHREAQKALVLLGSKTVAKAEAQLISVNATTVSQFKQRQANKDKPDDRRRTDTDTTEARNIKSVVCYHCGDKGHYTGRCPLRKSPQTTKGKAVWAKRNQDRGRDYQYQLDFYVQLSDKYEEQEKAKASRQSNKVDKHKNKHKDKEVIDVDSKSGDEMYDEED